MSGPGAGEGITLTPWEDSGQALALSPQGRGDRTTPPHTGDGFRLSGSRNDPPWADRLTSGGLGLGVAFGAAFAVPGDSSESEVFAGGLEHVVYALLGVFG